MGMASTRYIRNLAEKYGDPDYPVPGTPEWDEANFDPSDPYAGGYGEDEYVSFCEICHDPIDYCLGHGDLG